MRITTELLDDIWWMAMRYNWEYKYGDVPYSCHKVVTKCIPAISKHHLIMTIRDLDSKFVLDAIKEVDLPKLNDFKNAVQIASIKDDKPKESITLTNKEVTDLLIATALYAYPRHTIACCMIWDDILPIIKKLPIINIKTIYYALYNRRELGKNQCKIDAEPSNKFICMLKHIVNNKAYTVTCKKGKEVESAKCIKFQCYWKDIPLEGKPNCFTPIDIEEPRDCYMPIDRFKCGSVHCEAPEELIIEIKECKYEEGRSS